ncbi:DNA translocase FtsK [Sporolactobacillus sp. STCC-11]|uniref:DNA translocase FtsK n=1 Tax=Sporolactobacillus caesalpiniae TaxID=3230362 RepID=UPI0033964F81
MADRWWRHFFNQDNDDDSEHEQGIERSHPAAPVGRFKDTNRHAEVKMLARYPEHNMPAVKGHRLDKETHLPNQQVSECQKKKTPFRLTKVPSPVFGYRKPPDSFSSTKQDSSFYLDVSKETQEKRQIQERKQEDLLHPVELSSSADHPVLDRKITDQPSFNRTKGMPKEESHKENKSAEVVESYETVHPLSERSVQQESIAYSDHTQKQRMNNRAEEHSDKEATADSMDSGVPVKENEGIMRVKSRLPRSPHRQNTQSKVPFNVLMFHSDGQAKHVSTPNSIAERPKASELQMPLDLLNDSAQSEQDSDAWIEDKKATLTETLENFHVDADVIGYVRGPSVTRFDLHLHPGVKINKVLSLNEDIKLSLAARQIRIAPVPGTSAVGIEIPNKVRRPVLLKELLTSAEYKKSRAPLTAALGQDVSGNQVVTDLAKMPHGLIAGATGSGKSVCIHSLILSLIYRTPPEDLRFLLIDPKVVELAPYQEIPHLAAPVITEPKEAAAALKWAVEEMEQRYRLFADNAVRDMEGYNRKVAAGNTSDTKIPYIVIIIDELADLMMVAPQDVEESVCRIAQKARAAGIHLLVATQRPSVDVITGLIKSNIPTRIAFSVSSQTDSRTILDCGGAERLLGRGDLLFAENGSRSLRRLQACYVSDEEINRVTHAFQDWQKPDYLFSPETVRTDYERSEQEDELLGDAAAFVVEQGQASVSGIQRHFRVGYNRAARLVDELELRSIISANNGSKPRQVLVSKEKLREQLAEHELDDC